MPRLRAASFAPLALACALAACSGPVTATDASSDLVALDAPADTAIDTLTDAAVDAPADVAADAPSADPRTWAVTGTMHTRRSNHTATLLPSGRVVVIGGETQARTPLTSIEVYDPGTAQWTEVGQLPVARSNHSATLLADGRILVVGGGSNTSMGLPLGTDALDTAVLVDPATGASQTAGTMASARSHHSAVRLENGSVLVIGGATRTVDATTTLPDAVAITELFAPSTGQWSPGATMSTGRWMHQTAVLADGRVLVIGGATSTAGTIGTAELFDPATSLWRATATPTTRQGIYASAARLSSGRVLVAGGLQGSRFLGTALRFDPATSAWSAAAMLPSVRNSVALVALRSGRALAVGGFNYDSVAGGVFVDEALLYDDTTDAWTALDPLQLARSGHTATLLLSGDVLVAGGTTIAGETAECERSSTAP